MMLMLIMGIMFLISIQPIMMVFNLIFITLLYSLYIYKVMGSFWFSYALIMVMLSGVLVVFTYMVSLIPNENFEFYNLIFMVMLSFVFFEGIYKLYGKDMDYVSLNLWISYLSNMMLFLVMFLLSLMLMVVWMSCMNKGAMRVF